NLATAYLLRRNAPLLGQAPAPILDGPPVVPSAQAQTLKLAVHTAEGGGGSDVIAYPTLEGLFGQMDYCACEECRSILSPAAYLVDLLQFLDSPPGVQGNPQDVLLGRR